MAKIHDKTGSRYGRQVFERIRESLDVVMTTGNVLAGADSFIEPNYEVRDDGAWLRPNSEVDSLNWTPACDLAEGAEGADGPDPLAVPALPFPFSAGQLAAFMLEGWGWHLHERFAGENGQPDPDTLQVLLGGVRDVKPREALVEAFSALAQARRQVGEPDKGLERAEQAAAAALGAATEEAEKLHDWREAGITEKERSVRVRRRNRATAAAKAALKDAREARERDHETWRKAMVRWLLGVPTRKYTREEWAAMSNDEQVAAWWAGKEPEPTPEEAIQHLVGWCDATVRANYWFGLQGVNATEAAQLLSRQNPHEADGGEWLTISTPHVSPEARRELLRGFEDVGGTQPLTGWLALAKSRGWRYDPWVDEYIAAAGGSLPRPASGVAEVAHGNAGPKTSKVQRQEARYRACVEAGLSMPSDDYAHLPRGIGKVAKKLDISRQTLAADVKAYLGRLRGRGGK